MTLHRGFCTAITLAWTLYFPDSPAPYFSHVSTPMPFSLISLWGLPHLPTAHIQQNTLAAAHMLQNPISNSPRASEPQAGAHSFLLPQTLQTPVNLHLVPERVDIFLPITVFLGRLGVYAGHILQNFFEVKISLLSDTVMSTLQEWSIAHWFRTQYRIPAHTQQ